MCNFVMILPEKRQEKDFTSGKLGKSQGIYSTVLRGNSEIFLVVLSLKRQSNDDTLFSRNWGENLHLRVANVYLEISRAQRFSVVAYEFKKCITSGKSFTVYSLNLHFSVLHSCLRALSSESCW